MNILTNTCCQICKAWMRVTNEKPIPINTACVDNDHNKFRRRATDQKNGDMSEGMFGSLIGNSYGAIKNEAMTTVLCIFMEW